MSSPLENIKSQLDYLDALAHRIRISSDLLDREGLAGDRQQLVGVLPLVDPLGQVDVPAEQVRRR